MKLNMTPGTKVVINNRGIGMKGDEERRGYVTSIDGDMAKVRLESPFSTNPKDWWVTIDNGDNSYADQSVRIEAA